MKLLIFMAIGSYSVLASASPLITKVSGGGFTPQEYAGYEKCEVYADKVVITHQMGMHTPTAIQLKETRPLAIQGDLNAVIVGAKQEKLEQKDNFLCDAPGTSIVAHLPAQEEVMLFTTGGCGSPRQERVGALSAKLRNIVGLYCPKTYDRNVNGGNHF